MRALLVDDERLARKELRRLLEAHPAIRIVGEAKDAPSAREAMAEHEPDLLFLDVQMPGETGFDLLETLDSVPRVIFTTAYDEYALRAFEVSALDYLVKPIDPKRLARSVQRILREGPRRPPGLLDPKEGAADPDGAARGVLRESDRVFLRDGDQCWFVELRRVRLFESMDNYAQVHLEGESPLILRSLNELEEKLDPRVFFRANRSQIINLKAVGSIHPWFGGRLMARMDGGTEVVLSRRKSREFRERMSV